MYITVNKLWNHPDRISNFINNEIVQPITAEIHLTNACNNNCYYCGANKDDKKSMNFDVMMQTIEFLKHIGVKAVVFTGGGEPTLYKYFEDALILANASGMDVGLITNGLLTPYTDFIHLLTWVRFSIDAIDSWTYKQIRGVDSFNTVKNNINRVLELRDKTTVGVQVVVNKYNWYDLSKISGYLHEYFEDIDYVNFRPIESIEDPYESKEMSEIKRVLPTLIANKKNIVSEKFLKRDTFKECNAANFIVTVDPEGDVYLCCHHVKNKNYKYCNVTDKDIFFDMRKNTLNNLNNKGFNKIICPKGCRGSGINESLEILLNQKHKNFI